MWIFSFFICLFPFYNYPLFYDETILPGDISVIKFVGIIVFLNALAYISRSSDLRSRMLNNNFIALFFFMCWAILNSYVFRTIGTPSVLQMFVANLIFLVSYMILIDSKERATRVIHTYMFAMVLACYRTYREIFIYLPVNPGYRPSSTFGDPNYFSLAMIPVICFAIGMIAESFENGKRRKAVILLFVLGYYLVAFLFAASRGGIIGLLISIFLIFLASKRKKIIMVTSILFIVVTMPLLQERIINRFMTFFASESETERLKGDFGSNEIRKMLLEGGVLLIRRNWDFGVGAGNFNKRVAEVMPGLRAEGFMAHNTYIEVFSEHGIVGFMLFLASIFGIVWKIFQAGIYFRKTRGAKVDPLIPSQYAGFIGVLIASFFLSVQFDRIFYLNLAIAITSLSSFPLRIENANPHST